jgi:hypothetical protein
MTSTPRTWIPTRTSTLVTAILLASVVSSRATAADTIVQVNVDSVIDGRTVATASGTTITPWTAMQGVDGDGNADGYVTNAVETILVGMGKTVGGKAGVALPDDGMFPADSKGRYPAVQLHFSNAAPTTSPQTHQIYISATRGSQSFMFNVPQATYSKMFLFITASEGAAKLAITLNYAGGTAASTKTYMLPDYGVGGAGANDPVFFNLIAGMRKWGSNLNEGDSTTHTITGIEIAPDATGMLTSIKVEKMNGSHCVFWGATGIATSAVTTGAGGSTGGGTDGGAAGATADAGGGGGAGGGASGAGGSTGAGGSATGAGGSTTTGAGGSTTTGTGGSTTTGTGGSTTTGTGGSTTTGTGGSTTTGTGGSTTGTTGAAGTGGPKHSSGGGGCALAGAAPGHAAWLLLAAALAIVVIRRRR